MDIKWLVFDLGNVILTNDWHDDNEVKYQEFTDYFGIDYEDMEKGWLAVWDDYKVGKMTEDEFWKKFLLAAGAKNIQIAKAKELWRKYQEAKQGMLDLLSQLKKKYKLAVLSNTGKEWLEFKRYKFGLDKYFDVYVGSGDVGYAKPELEIYKILLRQISEPVENCVFIDDTPKTLPPAQSLGMQTIQFTDRIQLEKELTNLGVTW